LPHGESGKKTVLLLAAYTFMLFALHSCCFFFCVWSLNVITMSRRKESFPVNLQTKN